MANEHQSWEGPVYPVPCLFLPPGKQFKWASRPGTGDDREAAGRLRAPERQLSVSTLVHHFTVIPDSLEAAAASQPGKGSPESASCLTLRPPSGFRFLLKQPVSSLSNRKHQAGVRCGNHSWGKVLSLPLSWDPTRWQQRLSPHGSNEARLAGIYPSTHPPVHRGSASGSCLVISGISNGKETGGTKLLQSFPSWAFETKQHGFPSS